MRKRRLVRYAHRDMHANPWTIGELIEILAEFPKDYHLRFTGMCGELFFNRFKQRGEKVMTIELDDPGYMEVNKAWQRERPTRKSSDKKRGRIR